MGSKRGKETIGYSAPNAQGAATSAGGEREGETSKSHTQHLRCESPTGRPCSDREIHTQWREETIPSLSFAFDEQKRPSGLFYSPQINSWVLRSSIALGWSPQ